MAFPADKLFFGTNISLWAARWTGWDWTAIKAEIDLARSLGLNCIRTFGDIQARFNGDMSLADYTSRWHQFLDYCALTNLYVYVCGGVEQWIGGVYGADPTDQQIADQVAETIGIVDGYDCVFAYDLINEIFPDAGFTHGGDDFASKLHTTCRGATVKSLTLSRIMSADSDFSDTTWFGYAYCDHIDVHFYYPGSVQGSVISPLPGATNLLTTLRGNFPTKPICIGEFGANSGVSNRNTYYQAVLSNWTPTVNVYPMCNQWAIIDYPTQPEASGFVYGLFQSDGVTPNKSLIQTFNNHNPLLSSDKIQSGGTITTPGTGGISFGN